MPETVFQNAYKKLNSAQKDAVDTIDGPVMVIAGPGTGKTTILTLRIANILRLTDTPPNGILAITYTDAGVKAMRDKLHEIIGNRAHDVRIHTFHSFASSVIAEYPDHFIHINDRRQLTDIEQESLIISILENPKFAKLRPIGKPDAYLYAIIKTIEDAKREALTPEAVKKFASGEIEKIKKDESSISTRGATKGQLKAEAKELIEKCERTILFADIYDQYEQKKIESKKRDYSDLIIELLVALRRDELLLRLIQERFLYIHVDEHQDTNDAQNFIVAIIAEFFETPNIFIVGDEKQAIYRFQGASVENFLLLQKRWGAMKVISLDTNYRSHQSILDASFSVVENNYDGDEHKNLRVYLNSKSAHKSRPIDIVKSEDSNGLEKYLVSELKKIIEEDKNASVAIIVRRNRDLDRIIRLLESEGVSVTSERSIDIFNHPVGRLFFDLIEYLADPSRTDALAKTIIAGMWGMDFESGAEAIRSLKSGKKADFLSTSAQAGKKIIPNLSYIQSKLLDDSPAGFIIHIAEQSGFVKLIAKDPSYVHVWRGIVALSESLVRENDIQDPPTLLKSMLAYRASAESRSVKVTVGAPDTAIKAMTAHGSKGQEFDYVFIPYATEEAWVGRPRGSSFVLPKKQVTDSDIRDLRRLFYVALTRARKHVSILVPNEESDGKILSPIRFIEEFDKKHISEKTLPRTEMEISKETAKSQNNENNLKMVDLAKHVLLEKGLSVTALNHFLKCPNEFLYQSILKMPQAPSPSAEKGSAMHEAISRVWRLKERETENIEKTLKETVLEYLENSLLQTLEKEALKKELLENLPSVAKALTTHFGLEGEIFTEHWVEGVFEGNYNDKQIHIPIHGKLDAIIDNQSEVSVFDYKTKQAMSVAAIKGETKNTDGGYFRQLIFYKLLLSQNPKWREKRITPSLVFISPDSKGRCPTITLPIQDSDISNLKEGIQSLIDSVWSGQIATGRCDDKNCEWCGLRNL
ncbi:MAG TPA: ATP-dependent DNA helicase [Candidatus Paceibacterota bacterium]